MNFQISKEQISQLRDKMINCARAETPIGYREICNSVGICIDLGNESEKAKLSAVLGNISEEEMSQGRPLLSVIVVSKETKMPGNGFFNMAETQGKYHGGNNTEKKLEFFIQELKVVKEYWKNN